MYNPQFQSQLVNPEPTSGDLHEEVVNTHYKRLEENQKNGKIAHVISLAGQDGQNGRNGLDGSPGNQGASGNWGGGHGYAGSSGTRGTNGENGMHGQNGKDLHLVLIGRDPEMGIEMHGSYETTIKMQGESYIALTSKGGNGGRGGNGGKGGSGGPGGHGGNGREGNPGRDGFSPGQDGGRGTRGGNGGNGGNGGPGGSGGNGGSGGHAGSGGNVTLQAHNSALFMCFDIDSRAGVSGPQGVGGSGGSGGIGGPGGSGGQGGRGGRPGPPRHDRIQNDDGSYRTRTVHGSSGWKGSSGSRGSSGRNGTPGNRGRDGLQGQKSRPGNILYMVTNVDGTQMIEKGSSRYELTVQDFNVQGVFDDGIFEPGEEIQINNIQVTNTGSISLPPGSQIVFPSTSSFLCNPSDHYELPGLLPGESTLLPYTYRGQVSPVPEQVGMGRHSGLLNISSSGNLLMRPFISAQCSKTLPTYYPIRISGVNSPSQMGQKEVFPIIFELENISQVPYGSNTGHGDITFKIILQSGFEFENEEMKRIQQQQLLGGQGQGGFGLGGDMSSLIIDGPTGPPTVMEEHPPPMEMTFEPKKEEINIPAFQPDEEIEGEQDDFLDVPELPIDLNPSLPQQQFGMLNNSEFLVNIPFLTPKSQPETNKFRISQNVLFLPDVNFFDNGIIIGELRYKGKLIERFEQKVRCTPNFTQMLPEFKPTFDGLFITDQHINKQLFSAYTNVFKGLGLNMNIWDIERYRGLSVDTVTKRPHPISWVNQFQGKIIVSHLPVGNQFFFGTCHPKHVNGHFYEKGKKEFESGWIVMNPPNPQQIKTSFKQIFLQHCGTGNIKVDPDAISARYLVSSPKKDQLDKYLNDYCHNLQIKEPNKVFMIESKNFSPKKLGWGRYCLGTAFLKKMDFSRSSKFVLGGIGQLSILDGEQIWIHDRKCYTRKFWMIMKSVICGMKLISKLELFNKNNCLARDMNWKFIVDGGNKRVIDFDELIADCLYEDLKVDVRCDYNDLSRSNKYLEMIRNDFNILKRKNVQKWAYITVLRLYHYTCRTKEECKKAKSNIWKICQGIEKQIELSKGEKKECTTIAKQYKEMGCVNFGFVEM